ARCFPGARIEDWEPYGVQLRDARHHSDNRQRFIDALVHLLGGADEVSFKRKQLNDFDETMSFRYLNCPKVKRYLLKERGIELSQALSEGKRRGKPWMIYTLRRV